MQVPRRRLQKHTKEEKQRVLDAFNEGEDWALVAKHNQIPYSTATRIIRKQSVVNKPRGGAKARRIKCTKEVLIRLADLINKDCTFTLKYMRDKIKEEFGVDLAVSTIATKLNGMLYTIKQARYVPHTANNAVNKQKRKEFVEKLQKHHDEGCSNSLKANIKEMLAERREEIFSQGEFSSLVQRRMNLLYEAAIASLHKISPFLVSRMNMFCIQHWPAAKRMEDMLYGA
jgi:transposase